MKDKVEREFDRLEFANYLQSLAEQLREGKISSERGDWTVPETFGAKIQIKEKKGRIEAKLQWRWSTLVDYAHQEREQIDAWLTSMKSVKKKMGSSFKELTRAAEAGNFPDNKSVDEFVATCRVFAEAAEPEWQETMDEYMDHLENFIRAIEKQEFEVMLHEIRDLSYRMKGCHKEFK
jgi:XXXCH domain-containing protein